MAPLPIHGVVHGPSLIRPIAASSQLWPSAPCSQIQRSACSAPQLWPTMPRQPPTSSDRPATSTEPVNRAAGNGVSVSVRGSFAVYIHSRGRCQSGGSDDSNPSFHNASPASPDAPPSPIRHSPTRSQSPSPLPGSGSVILVAYGPSAAPSKNVNHTEPVGSAPGSLWTVYLIHTPSGSPGWQSFRYQLS